MNIDASFSLGYEARREAAAAGYLTNTTTGRAHVRNFILSTARMANNNLALACGRIIVFLVFPFMATECRPWRVSYRSASGMRHGC